MKHIHYYIIALLGIAANTASAHVGPHHTIDATDLAIHFVLDHWYVAVPLAALAIVAVFQIRRRRNT